MTFTPSSPPAGSLPPSLTHLQDYHLSYLEIRLPIKTWQPCILQRVKDSLDRLGAAHSASMTAVQAALALPLHLEGEGEVEVV